MGRVKLFLVGKHRGVANQNWLGRVWTETKVLGFFLIKYKARFCYLWDGIASLWRDCRGMVLGNWRSRWCNIKKRMVVGLTVVWSDKRGMAMLAFQWVVACQETSWKTLTRSGHGVWLGNLLVAEKIWWMEFFFFFFGDIFLVLDWLRQCFEQIGVCSDTKYDAGQPNKTKTTIK